MEKDLFPIVLEIYRVNLISFEFLEFWRVIPQHFKICNLPLNFLKLMTMCLLVLTPVKIFSEI